MVSTWEFDFGGWRSFPGSAGSTFVFQFCYCELPLKNHCGNDRRPNFIIFLVWSALIAGGWVGGGGIEEKILFRAGWNSAFVCLVLFKDWGRRVSPRIYFFVSVVKQGNEEAGWVQDFLAWPQGWKGSP